MPVDRRQMLKRSSSALLVSAFPFLPSAAFAAAKAIGPAALLIPRTGPSAAVGRSMERAALLAQGTSAKNLLVFDTGGTPAGAAAAAKQAMKRHAALILGPLLAAEVRPVLAAVGSGIPVLTFSNDAGLIESGAFLLGLTAQQGTSAILRYAHGRGVRRVVVISEDGERGRQTLAAAKRVAAELGLDLVAVAAGALDDRALASAALTPGGEAPDAVLAAIAPARLPTVGAAITAGGAQLLAAYQGLDYAPAALTALEGAWLSAPDPSPFDGFARAFQDRSGTAPGIITGLAYDAASIAAQLRQRGGADRAALLDPAGFKGVCGDLRFRDDGSAGRAMAILAVERGSYRLVDRIAP